MSGRIRIDAIVIGERHRKDLGDLKELARSIKEQGLLQPIGITADRRLVFGARRVRACKDILGWTEIDARVVNVSSIVGGEYAENEVRKDFTPSERVSIADAVRAAIGSRQGQRTDLSRQSEIPLAEIRTARGCFTCKNRDMIYDDGGDLCICTARGNEPMSPDFDNMAFLCRGELWKWHGETLPEDDAAIPVEGAGLPHRRAEVEPGEETRDAAARLAGFGSREEYRRAKRVAKTGTPELVAQMDAGRIPVSAAAVVAKETPEIQNRVVEKVRQGKRASQALGEARNEKAAAGAPPLPASRYRVIVVDPPWPTDPGSQESRTGRRNSTATKLKKLKALKVAELAADKAHVFVWARQDWLPTAIDLVRDWGFEYALTLVWRKTGGPPPVGLPLSNCEFVVCGCRGEAKFTDTDGFECCFDADAVEREGSKPEIFYERVRWSTEGPRLEILSGEAHDGFDQFFPDRIVAPPVPVGQPKPHDDRAPANEASQADDGAAMARDNSPAHPSLSSERRSGLRSRTRGRNAIH